MRKPTNIPLYPLLLKHLNFSRQIAEARTQQIVIEQALKEYLDLDDIGLLCFFKPKEDQP